MKGEVFFEKRTFDKLSSETVDVYLSKNGSQTRGSEKDEQGIVQDTIIIQSTHKRPLCVFYSSGFYTRDLEMLMFSLASKTGQ